MPPLNFAVITSTTTDNAIPHVSVVQEATLQECQTAFDKIKAEARVDDLVTSNEAPHYKEALEALAALSKIPHIERAMDWIAQVNFDMGRRYEQKKAVQAAAAIS